jgi:N-acetylmuramic acid 6-phosphate etherase
MVDLKATNLKLRQRARNVLRAVAGPTCVETDAELDLLLSACRGSVKLACASLATGLSVVEAEEHLSRHDGVLARVIESSKSAADSSGIHDDSLVLCVDAGGSSCKAVILSSGGLKVFGSAGPCNV